MNTPTRAVRITDPASSALSLTLRLPDGWTELTGEEALPDEVIAVFSDAGVLATGFTSTAVVISQQVPDGLTIGDWQARTRAQQLATLPDLHIFEDRQLADAPSPTWYRARTVTGQGPATLLVREWSRILAGRGLTLTLTTVPMADAEHADLFDEIAASWTTTTSEDQA
jgi:hypothetical protein